ncbi:hypothetical protein GCM10018793_66730 [Streptomyces sulfonofaciens]|uniref:Uncharacterized protein n=1 Tax=Streptomyces sulfonofaciens TaxID=68272 RepID=A0A919L8R1_9ACTN|nr:hypothetical protein GCM10018793_66730 [Streptomyces sulfonofaciens]
MPSILRPWGPPKVPQEARSSAGLAAVPRWRLGGHRRRARAALPGRAPGGLARAVRAGERVREWGGGLRPAAVDGSAVRPRPDVRPPTGHRLVGGLLAVPGRAAVLCQ